MEIFRMSIPSVKEFFCLSSNAVKACCAIYNVELCVLDDIGIAVREALYCLSNQSGRVDNIMIECLNEENGVVIEFTALSTQVRENLDSRDDEISRGIFEKLVPKVNLLSDERGIFCITFFFPRNEDCNERKQS